MGPEAEDCIELRGRGSLGLDKGLFQGGDAVPVFAELPVEVLEILPIFR